MNIDFEGFPMLDDGVHCPGCEWVFPINDETTAGEIGAAIDAHIPIHA